MGHDIHYRTGDCRQTPVDQQRSTATAIGIHTVFHVILAARAEDSTGAIISATTQGRMPMNILDTTGLFFIMSGVRNTAMASIIRNDGRIVPNAATMLPLRPRSLSPIDTDMFTARMPGRDCDTASRSRNSSLLIHRLQPYCIHNYRRTRGISVAEPQTETRTRRAKQTK